MKPLITLLLCLILCSCNRYVVTLNDRQVYQPADPFDDFVLADKALDTCIRQTLADNQITRANQLHTLNCSQAGISSLQGIELFSGLRNLNLAGNNLMSVSPLLYLDALEKLNIADNPSLKCAEIEQFTNHSSAQTLLPDQCKQ